MSPVNRHANREVLGTFTGYTSAVRPYGAPANTGDGLAMLQRTAAKLWHMRNVTETGGIHPGIKVPGHRFYPEASQYHDTHFKHSPHARRENIPSARVTPVYMLAYVVACVDRQA